MASIFLGQVQNEVENLKNPKKPKIIQRLRLSKKLQCKCSLEEGSFRSDFCKHFFLTFYSKYLQYNFHLIMKWLFWNHFKIFEISKEFTGVAKGKEWNSSHFHFPIACIILQGSIFWGPKQYSLMLLVAHICSAIFTNWQKYLAYQVAPN